LFPDHPNIGVNLYAYSSHAEPPSFPLNPRVFVQLVPYQFQNIAFGPSFIKLWSQKVKRFGIYDYLNYADAQWDLPGGNTLEETMLRLMQSFKSGSEGTNFETSYSKFATGIPLWVIGRYLNDGDADWKKNLDLLTNDLYNPGALLIKDVFTTFYLRVGFNQGQLGNVSELLSKASSLSNDKTYQKRLIELKEYLYYIHLVFQARNESGGSLIEKQTPLLKYAWQLYETKIINSYRIMQLVCYGFLNVNQSDPNYKKYYQTHLEWFPETEKQKAAWSNIPQFLSPAEIEKNFQTLKKAYATVSIEPSFNINDVWSALGNQFKPQKQFILSSNYLQRAYFNIASKKTTSIRIRYKLTATGTQSRITLSGIDKNYSTPQAFVLTEPQGEFSFTIPAGETSFFVNAADYVSYRMQVTINEGLIYFPGSPRMMGFYKKFDDPDNLYTYQPGYFPTYVFIPGGITTVQYKVQLNALGITSPSGKTYPSKVLSHEEAGFETREFSFPTSESGKLWKAVVSGNYNYSFINIPDQYFLLEANK
jgi:hypothetical protein